MNIGKINPLKHYILVFILIENCPPFSPQIAPLRVCDVLPEVRVDLSIPKGVDLMWKYKGNRDIIVDMSGKIVTIKRSM